MRKSVTLNKFFNIAVISGLLLFSACVFLPPEEGEDVAITVFLIIVSLFLIICPIFATPCFYLFDEEGVSIHYVFYSKERYLWKNIYSINYSNEKIWRN